MDKTRFQNLLPESIPSNAEMECGFVAHAHDMREPIRMGIARFATGLAQCLAKKVVARNRFNRDKIIPMCWLKLRVKLLIVQSLRALNELVEILSCHGQYQRREEFQYRQFYVDSWGSSNQDLRQCGLLVVILWFSLNNAGFHLRRPK